MTATDDITGLCVTESPGYLLRRAHRGSLQLAETRFTGEELSFVQWIALVLLRDGVADTAGALARIVGHDAGAMTRLLDQLEVRGMLQRERSQTDRRVVHLVLSAEGRAAVHRLAPRVKQLWDDLLVDFSEDEIVTFKSLLWRVIARLDAMDGGDAA